MEVEDMTNRELLDSIHKLIDGQKGALEEQRVANSEAITAHQRHTMEMLDDIRADLGDLHLRLDRAVPSGQVYTTSPTAASSPTTPKDGEIGPNGHREEQSRRGKAHEVPPPYVPPPARGAQFSRPNTPRNVISVDESPPHHRSLPKIDFPRFDGTCPKLWQQRCEDYFHLYSTPKPVWISVATMQFDGAAARWLQSVQRKLSTATWEKFCGWLLVRFGRNQHQALMRQLYQIHQTTTVTDYVERFAELIDHLAAYEPNF